MVKSTRLNIFHFIFRSIFCYITLGAVNWWSRRVQDDNPHRYWTTAIDGSLSAADVLSYIGVALSVILFLSIMQLRVGNVHTNY